MAERILAACALALAAGYLYATSTLPAFEIGDPLGPRAFPVLLGILFAFAGGLLMVETLVKRPAAAERPAAAGTSHPRAVAIATTATLAFFAVLEPLGYLLAMTAYLFALMRWLHGRNSIACAVVAVLFAIASYALFAKALGVTLARGLLHF